MQPHSPPPPFGRPVAPRGTGPAPGGPQPADRNEFTDAVARMFEHRQRSAPDFAPPLRDDIRMRENADEWDAPRVSLLSALVGTSGRRRALSIVPLAVIAFATTWFFYFEPSQNVTAKPAVEIRKEVDQAVTPMELPPPARPEVVEAKPVPSPSPAATPAAVAVVPPSRPLSKDEIKELQDKLGAVGFAAGPSDGVIGPLTQAALRRYAQARSLARPDATQETLLRLRAETQAGE